MGSKGEGGGVRGDTESIVLSLTYKKQHIHRVRFILDGPVLTVERSPAAHNGIPKYLKRNVIISLKPC